MTALLVWLVCKRNHQNNHWFNNYVTMALGSTQPLREMSTRNISWG